MQFSYALATLLASLIGNVICTWIFQFVVVAMQIFGLHVSSFVVDYFIDNIKKFLARQK
jgi:predicted membrane-bound spermidine synthase